MTQEEWRAKIPELPEWAQQMCKEYPKDEGMIVALTLDGHPQEEIQWLVDF